MQTSESAFEEVQPEVRRTDGFIVPWNRDAIVRQLLTETKLAKEFYDVRPIGREEAEEIAIDVEKRIFDSKLRFVSGPLIREMVNSTLLDRSNERPEYSLYRNLLTRVGTPVHDAYLIDIGKDYVWDCRSVLKKS